MGHFAAGSSSRSRYERSSARRGTTLLVLPLDVRIISHRSHHLASPTQQGAPSCTVSLLYDLARRGVAAPTQQGHPRAQPSMLCDLVRQGAETAQQRSRTHRRRRALPLRMFVVRTKAHTSPGGLMRGGVTVLTPSPIHVSASPGGTFREHACWMSGSRCPEASGSFRPASSLVQSRAHNTHAVTVMVDFGEVQPDLDVDPGFT